MYHFKNNRNIWQTETPQWPTSHLSFLYVCIKKMFKTKTGLMNPQNKLLSL